MIHYNGEAAKTMDNYIASLESFAEFGEDVVSFEQALNEVLDHELELTIDCW